MNAAGIKELYDRKARSLKRRPTFGRGSGHAWIRLAEGLACDIDHEDQTTRADQPESEGGTGSGPRPGQLMRASLGACLAMGYRIWGARLDVRIDAVGVEIICGYDARGQMGLSAEVPVGWQRILFAVTVTSAETRDAVRNVVETADRLCPMLANLSPSIRRTHLLTVVPPSRPQGVIPDGHQTVTTEGPQRVTTEGPHVVITERPRAVTTERAVPSQVTPLKT